MFSAPTGKRAKREIALYALGGASTTPPAFSGSQRTKKSYRRRVWLTLGGKEEKVGNLKKKFLDLVAQKKKALAPHEGFVGIRADGALKGTNGDIDGELVPLSSSSGSGGEEGFFFIPAAPLRALEGEALEITPQAQVVVVRGGNITLTLGVFGDEYPPLVLPPRPGEEEEGFGVEVPMEGDFLRSFAEAMRTVVPMAAQEGASRPLFQGVQVECGGAFRVVATDGYRLGLKDLGNLQVPRAREFSLILPRKWVPALAGLLEEGKRGTLYPNGTGVGVVLEGDSWIARLYVRAIPGKLPPYEGLIPQGPWGSIARFGAEEALRVLEKLSPLSDEGRVRVSLTPERLKFEVAGPYGGGEAIIQARTEGTESSFSFHLEHLSDALRGARGEVEMKFLPESPSPSPVLIESEGYKALIVPLKE
jgi:DNA polymerase III sliding clamp (beta) subunit (PCNA family)